MTTSRSAQAILFAARRLQDVADPTGIAPKHADIVERGVHRIQHIVGDLLDLAREREGAGIPIERKPADLRAVCRQIIDELETIARDRQITFECEVDGAGAWDERRSTCKRISISPQMPFATVRPAPRSACA